MSNTSDLHRQLPWWELDGDDAGSTMTATADELRDRDETRRQAIRIWQDLYEGRGLLDPSNASALAAISSAGGPESPRLNFARRAVDHVHSKVTAETPAVRALGHGADARTRVRARRLSKFIQGIYADLDLETVLPRAGLEVLITGAGLTGVSHRDGKITVETVSAREVLFDPDDARHGDPRVMYRVRQVDPQGLALDCPEHSEAILSAPKSSDPLLQAAAAWTLSDGRSDAIDLYDAWVLPRGDQGGRHIQSVSSEVLVDEEWEAPRFPIGILTEREPAPGTGVYGLGLMARIDGAQFEIDRRVAHIGEGLDHANMKVFVQGQADIVMDHLTDPSIGTIVVLAPGAGTPTFQTPNPVSPQELDWLKYLVSQLYSMAGMDESAVSSQIPAGITSGIGQRMYHDFQAQSYVDLTKRYGRHCTDVVQRVIDEAKRMCGQAADDPKKPSWTVRYRRGSVVRELDWSDVDMDADAFVLELEEVSPVPDSPAGRISQIEEDAAAGRISPEYMANLREDPDRWMADRLEGQADADFVDDLVERLQDPDLPMPRVLDEMDKPLAAQRLRTEVLHAVRNDDDPQVVERMQDYLAELTASMEPPPQAMPLPPPNGGPSVPPGAPPMSPPPGASGPGQ